LPSALASSA
jgi:hypothetical protein